MADILATTEKVTREKRVLVGPPQPTRQTIYEKESGKPLEVFAVDAVEILNQPDSAYQATPPGEKQAKAAPLDHTVKEVIGTSSTPTMIETPAPAKTTAKSDKADTK